MPKTIPKLTINMKTSKWIVEFLTINMEKRKQEIASDSGFNAMKIVTTNNPGSIAIGFSRVN